MIDEKATRLVLAEAENSGARRDSSGGENTSIEGVAKRLFDTEALTGRGRAGDSNDVSVGATSVPSGEVIRSTGLMTVLTEILGEKRNRILFLCPILHKKIISY